MKNCKTCVYERSCGKKIRDYNTRYVCKQYSGTCANCIHANTSMFGRAYCIQHMELCENIRFCGMWEYDEPYLITGESPDDYYEFRGAYCKADTLAQKLACTKKFIDQLKKDFHYLNNKEDNK